MSTRGWATLLVPMLFACAAEAPLVHAGIPEMAGSAGSRIALVLTQPLTDFDGTVDGTSSPDHRSPAKPKPWAPAMLLLLFTVLLALPFAPALVELFVPSDDEPLRVDMKYTRDPRYLGQSARRVLSRALGAVVAEGMRTVQMSREERVEIAESPMLAAGSIVPHVLCVRGDLATQNEVAFEMDLFVRGTGQLGPVSRARTIACDGELVLGAGCTVVRWADAEGRLEAGRGSILGMSASTPQSLHLANNVEFRRLYGNPIRSPSLNGGTERDVGVADRSGATTVGLEPRGSGANDAKAEPNAIRTIEDVASLHRGTLEIAVGGRCEKPLVVRGDLILAPGSTLKMPARVYGMTVVGHGALVTGDLFCEGPVRIEPGAVILANVFSQESVHVGAGARLGAADAIKSLIGRRGVTLEEDVLIHGFVVTDGAGRVACRMDTP